MLSTEETQNPYMAFYNLFDFADLEALKGYLWLWLKITVTNGYTKEMYKFTDRDMIFIIYEQVQKLFEAAHVIYEEKYDELHAIDVQMRKAFLEDAK